MILLKRANLLDMGMVVPRLLTEKMRAARHGQAEAFEHFTEARVRSGSKDEDGKFASSRSGRRRLHRHLRGDHPRSSPRRPSPSSPDRSPARKAGPAPRFFHHQVMATADITVLPIGREGSLGFGSPRGDRNIWRIRTGSVSRWV